MAYKRRGVRAYKLGVGAYKQQLMIWKDRGITPFPLHESRDAISQGKFNLEIL